MSSSTSIAAPSPMLIPCRALSNGLHGSGSMRRNALKPLNVSRASASVPPQIAASSSPSRIRSAAWPIAIVLDEHADPRAIQLAVEQAGVVEGLGRGHDTELLAPRPAATLVRRETSLQVEGVDLTGNLAAERGHVEQRDRTQAAQAGNHVLPVGFAAGAERRDDADAGDRDAPIAPGRAHKPGSG